VILGIGALVRLWNLGAASLWHDESWTWALVRGSPRALLHDLIVSDAHPPLYFLVLWPLSKLGVSEWMLRAPSAFLGIASLPLVFRLGRTVGNVPSGLLAMAFLALAPFHIKYSQEARSYSLLFFLCALSLLILLRLRRSPRSWRVVVGLAGVTALIVYTEYLGVFFILGEIALVAAWSKEDRGLARQGLWAALLAFVFFLPWLPFALRHVTSVGGGFWMPRPTPGIVWYEVRQLLAYPHGTWTWLQTLSALPLAILALSAPVLGRRKDLWSWVLSALLPVAAQVGVGLRISIFCARGLIYVLAPLVVLAGISAAALAPWARALAAGGVIVATVPGLRFVHGGQEKEDWRSAVAFLRREASPDDLILVHEGYLDVSVRYYWGEADPRPEILDAEKGSLMGPATPLEDVVARARGHRKVWLVRRTYVERPEIPELLGNLFLPPQEHRWRYVSVTRFLRRS
jgi:4-amino-4-deoxy-L-arabinose transferase-like glycosyltransferase